MFGDGGGDGNNNRSHTGVAHLHHPMKRFALPFILVSLVFVPACQTQEPQSLPPIEVYFSPRGGCTEAVVKEISAAKTSVLVQAYSFMSVPIAKAVVSTSMPECA